MRSLIDLHIHTAASDGSDSPAQLARKISEAGLRVFSVTDHDTVDGALEMEMLVPAGVRYIRGVEFSCTSPAGKCHILGYGYDPAHPSFRAALEEGRILRRSKTQARLRDLKERWGIELTQEEEQWLWSRKSPGKPHLGRILTDRGIAPDLDTAIRCYIGSVPGQDRIEAQRAVRAILIAGGLPVWAHPLGGEGERRLTMEKFEALLLHLRACGIRGMECWYSRYSLEETEFLCSRAGELGLTVTGGSDYHGANKRGLELGMLNSAGVPWPEEQWGCFT